MAAQCVSPPLNPVTTADRPSRALLRRLARTPHGRQRQALLDRVVEEFIGLADGIARHYARRGVEVDDLEQVARMGLVLAVNRFRPEVGVAFEAFAIPTIRGEIRRYFRDHGWLVRPPRRVQELRQQVRDTSAELTQAHGGMPTSDEVADVLGIDGEDVRECQAAEACFGGVSLDAPAPGDQAPSPMDTLGEESARLEALPDQLALRRALHALSDRDRRMLEWRFAEGLTQGQIGARLGVSQMQVSRILARILEALRSTMDVQPAAS